MTTISTDELRERLGDPRLTIVDIRPLAAYNGWRINGEARGGHIPGAVAFPAAWLQTVDDDEIQRLLEAKGITPDRDIVVHGQGPADAAAFVAGLRVHGIDTARAHASGATGWAADDGLPLEKLPRHEALVHIPWLREVLDGGRPEAPPTGSFLLFHVNFGVPEE
ncbi:MAG: sulfurtransferase, partial [Acidimicrobiales bacterium]